MDWNMIFAAISLEVAILGSATGLVWKISRSEMSMRAEYTKEIASARAEQVKACAELSAKIYQVEIWARDEFVRKGSFEAVIARMEKGFFDLRSEITGRLDKMTERIEHFGQQE